MHVTINLTTLILKSIKSVTHTLYNSHIFELVPRMLFSVFKMEKNGLGMRLVGVLFLQLISINHLVLSIHMLIIIYGISVKKILTSLILVDF